MDQNNKICQIDDHDEYPLYHICTFFECISQGSHNHNKSNISHILKIKDLLI